MDNPPSGLLLSAGSAHFYFSTIFAVVRFFDLIDRV